MSENPFINVDVTTKVGKTRRTKGKERVREGEDNFVKANWTNEKHLIWLHICLDEARNGNKPAATLNAHGYANLISKFEEKTGCVYTRSQFKNHWDATRKDWQNWIALHSQTGGGWDGELKDQTDEWWSSFCLVSFLFNCNSYLFKFWSCMLSYV